MKNTEVRCPTCGSDNISILFYEKNNKTLYYGCVRCGCQWKRPTITKQEGDNMKKTVIRCPSCRSNFTWSFGLEGKRITRWICGNCDYKWIIPHPMIEDTRHSPLELKEHFHKDRPKLTKQDKLDLQIDLWQYGKR